MLPFRRITSPSTVRHIRIPLLLVAAALLWAGCDTSVDTFVPDDERVYSIFGVLDVAADTQFIRVEPLTDSTQIGTPPDIDATVTLEHLGAERTITLRDSLMEMRSDVLVHNFWTAEPIEAGATYRLRVERSDGAASEATATLPAQPPDLRPQSPIYFPCCAPNYNTFSVVISEADRIAAVRVLYPIQELIHTADYFDDVTEHGDDLIVEVNYERDLRPFLDKGDGLCPPGLDRPYAWVAASAAGPGFPDLRGVDLDEFARPDSFSNVENGHGLFGGVYSDTIQVPVAWSPCA